MNNVSKEYWNNIFKSFTKENIIYDDWLFRFDNIINNCDTPIIDLGCGYGNNILYLTKKNKKVIACDFSTVAIKNIKKYFPEIYKIKCFNMLDKFPFPDNFTDIIISDLSIHYFKKSDTIQIIDEIKRVLTPDGYLLLRVNSIKDINYMDKTQIEVEKNLYLSNDILKRFFTKKDLLYFFKDFVIEYLKEEKMYRYEKEKILYCACLKNRK